MADERSFWDSAQRNEAHKKEYAEHKVFQELKSYMDFYDRLSMSILSFPTPGTRAVINIDTYVYSSIQGTLESISHVLRNGRIGDAFALMRKYYDSVIINVYTNLYLENNHSTENFIVEKITKWLEGSEQLPEYRQMSQYIRDSDRLRSITDLLYSDGSYKKTRERCNDNLHYNFFQNLMINDNQVHLKNRIDLLNLLEQDAKNIFILHLSYIFYLKDHYMCSSDYLDALEVGMQPEENSQYWVAPFVQDVFTNVIEKERPDLAKVIIENTAMQLALGER